MMALVHPNVKVTTIERDEKRYLEAVKNVKAFGLEDRIIKLNRHDRFVTLDCKIFNGKFNVAIEMVD